MKVGNRRTALTACMIAAAICCTAQAQVPRARSSRSAMNFVVPQARMRSFVADTRRTIEVTDVTVAIVVLEQVATVTMDIAIRNPSPSRQEAVLMVPVPDGATVRGFTFQGAGKEPSAEILPKDEARKTYQSIVAKIKDPALLEFVDHKAIRSSVFPVDGHGTQKVRLTYECLLKADGGRIDFELPRSQTTNDRARWNVSMTIKSKRPVSTAYSPTHELAKNRLGPGRLVVQTKPRDAMEAGPFRLSYLLESKDGMASSLIAYPDPKVKGGYFLLLAGLPARFKPSATVKREVTLVIDRSGSMNGEKMRQAREAALQVLSGLEDEEAFNIIAYNETVDCFMMKPVVKTGKTMAAAREYLAGIKPRGGTNIHDALLEALRQKPLAKTLPIVLFLTDGRPTIGRTSEIEIGRLVEKSNPHSKRVFTFGVGEDVNVPLLDKVSDIARGTATYVLPKEDVEVKVAQVFKKLAGPVLTTPHLTVGPVAKDEFVKRIADVLPQRLPDMFYGDQMVVLGRYIGDEPLKLRLSGEYFGEKKTFEMSFDLCKATTKNAFVPRLWASRRIAVLIDAIRQAGAETSAATVLSASAADPHIRELMDEIVRLSVDFGVLTEYTAFLAKEGTDLGSTENVVAEMRRNLKNRALNVRSGLGAINQGFNYQYQSRQFTLNRGNGFWDQNMNRVEISNVRQVDDRVFYQRGNRWIDGRIAARKQQGEPDKVVEIGSKEFMELAKRLAKQNRQACVALKGEILLEVDGERVLCR